MVTGEIHILLAGTVYLYKGDIVKKRQRVDLVWADTITTGVGAGDWDGAASYDLTDPIFDFPLSFIIKSATVICEMEATPGIPIAYTVVLHQGDQLTISDDASITDLLEQGDGVDARIEWLPDNVVTFVMPYMYNTNGNWVAETQDLNMFVSRDSFLNMRIHLEDAIGGDTNPTASGELDFHIILEVEVL